MSENETQDIVINGVSVITIADYAKRRHLTVPFVTNMIKGDDQNPKIEPVYKIGSAGMYAIDDLDVAYLSRGTKGLTLASMGYLHPGKARELESRILELVNEKSAILAISAETEISLQEAEEELEDVKSRLAEAQRTLDGGKKQYAKLLEENAGLKDMLRATLRDALRAYDELEWANSFQARLDEL